MKTSDQIAEERLTLLFFSFAAIAVALWADMSFFRLLGAIGLFALANPVVRQYLEPVTIAAPVSVTMRRIWRCAHLAAAIITMLASIWLIIGTFMALFAYNILCTIISLVVGAGIACILGYLTASFYDIARRPLIEYV